MRSRALLLLAALSLPALAGPVEFGMAEIERAMAARGLRPGSIRFNAEIGTDEPETFRIAPGRISGGDLRGLMYGLLEAAEQIRETGRLARAKGAPATPIRGVRYVLESQELEKDWYYSREHWEGFFAMLARNRFNRFQLVFAGQANYLARGLVALRTISQAAAEHGVDFILGIESESAELRGYEALHKALAACPAIRGIAMRADSESNREAAFHAIGQAGRRVTLDLPPGPLPSAIVEAARNARVPLRVAARYWAGDLGRPYQPAETFPGFSYANLLEKPLHYDFYWSLGSHRLLLSGDPDFVRRAVATFPLGGGAGFEIDAPFERKERPFDRYWLFYLLWGRLSYDPKTPEKVWMAEMKRRFGPAAGEVLAAYQAASGVLGEIVAASLADPNLSGWPEINPGGLLDAYRDARSSDWRFIAGAEEAVRNRVQGLASAKQTPAETAVLLRERSQRIEAALARAQAKVPEGNREWQASQADFRALALLARYHSHKQAAADQVTYFDQTGDATALETAQAEIAAAVADWEKLAAGPDSIAPWKNKLPYVRHDLRLIEERQKISEQFSRFDFGFDFGGSSRSGVAPRFQPVDPRTKFSQAAGFGWVGEGERQAHALPLKSLPVNVLYGDWIDGRGAQVFRIRAADGVYSVFFLRPDGTATPQKLRARNGALDVVFPEGEWMISGLVVKGPRAAPPLPPQDWPKRLPRPNIAHAPPKTAPPDRPLELTLRITPSTPVKAVRLHYRPVNQLAEFKTLENAGAKGSFTIPAGDVSTRWDLMYYFEVLNQENAGWFDPDPRTATPYYVVPVEAAGPQ